MYIINELHAQLNIDPNLDKNTTLNTKYQLFQDELPTVFPPKIQYFGIGINGFKTVESGGEQFHGNQVLKIWIYIIQFLFDVYPKIWI